MVETRKTKTAMHRVAVLFTCFLAIYLGVRWNASAMPERSPRVGETAVLTEDAFAIITLNKGSDELDLAQSISQLYQLDLSKRTVLVLKNGSMLSIDDSERSKYITNASRAHGWFRPTYIGSVHYMDEPQTKPLIWRPDSLKIPLEDSKETLSAGWGNASRGYHVHCEETCSSLSDARLPSAHVLHGADIFHTTDGNIIINFNERGEYDDILKFLHRSVQISRPSTERKLLADGTPYNEIIPSTQTVDTTETFEGGSMQIISSGDFAWHITHTNDAYVASTSKTALLSRLSTVPLTNKVCGEKVVWFMNQVISQEQATNQHSLARTKSHLIICK